MACGGTRYGHGGVEWRNPAVVLSIAGHAPPARCLFLDLDDSTAVGGHLDVDKFGRHAREADCVLTAQTGEHDLFVGVFVVDAEQAARACVIQRGETHVVVVVAELAQLRGRRLVHHVKVRRIGGDRVSPA